MNLDCDKFHLNDHVFKLFLLPLNLKSRKIETISSPKEIFFTVFTKFGFCLLHEKKRVVKLILFNSRNTYGEKELCVRACVHVCVHARVHMCVYACVCACACVHASVYMRACLYMHAHTQERIPFIFLFKTCVNQ